MIDKRLIEEYVEKNGKIRIAIAGAGYICRGLVNQIKLSGGIEIVAIASRTKDKAIELLKENNLPIDRALETVLEIPEQDVDIVVDLTGDVELGARIAYNTIMNQRHIVSTAETDATVGPVLAKMAKEQGVIFTNMWGDEPGLIKSIYDYASILGLDLIALGKFKGFHSLEANPDSVKYWAEKSGQNPWPISSFADGSKLALEMTVVSNATGFEPDVQGMHMPEGTLEEVAEILKFKEEGGILNRKGVIEVVRGVQPSGGVFGLFRTDNKQIAESLKYYKMGEGPNYMLYRPYHMPGIEMVFGLFAMMILGKGAVTPMGKPVSDTISLAKKDLNIGDVLGPIGDYTYSGIISLVKEARKLNAVPLGILKGAVMRRAVKRGNIITMDDVEIKDHDLCLSLRTKFEEMI